MTQPTASQRLLADALMNLAKRIREGYEPANGTDADDRAFERTGYLMIRAGILTLSEGDRARRLAADWSARGYPAGGTDGPSPSASDDTSVERALEQTDQWERTRTMLDHERRIIDDNVRAFEHRIANTIKVTPQEDRRTKLLADTLLDLDCANPHCDAKISGIGDDRPRRGRCPRCFKYLSRNGRDWTSRAEPCPHHETAGHRQDG